MNYIELSIENVVEETNKLYNLIKKDYNYDLVIFISKGSYPIGYELAKLNNVPLLEVFASRKGGKLKKIIKPFFKFIPKSILIKLREKEMKSEYHENKNERNVSFDFNEWSKYKNSKKILLVDDSVDTGWSIISAKKEIEKFFENSNLKVAAFNYFEKSKKNISIDYNLYKDTMIQGPWSNDSKYYNQFLEMYFNYKKNKKSKISVAMATYNGEKYIKEQINSILNNLSKDDELIISDDGSTDNTIKIIKEYIKKDSRIKFFDGPKLGVKQNFANAIKNCTGDYIFLSDQDDIWEPNKVSEVMNYFKNEKVILVEHDCTIVDNDYNIIEDSFFKFRKCGKGTIKNIYKNTYIGCCMAFDAKLKEKILPIPNNIEMHDQWIGLIAERNGNVKFINKNLIKYRRHGENVTTLKHYPLKKMIINRLNLIKEYIKRRKKV